MHISNSQSFIYILVELGIMPKLKFHICSEEA